MIDDFEHYLADWRMLRRAEEASYSFVRHGYPPTVRGFMWWRLSQAAIAAPAESAGIDEHGKIWIDDKALNEVALEFQKRLEALFYVNDLEPDQVGWRTLALRLVAHIDALSIGTPSTAGAKRGRPPDPETERRWFVAIWSELVSTSPERKTKGDVSRAIKRVRDRARKERWFKQIPPIKTLQNLWSKLADGRRDDEEYQQKWEKHAPWDSFVDAVQQLAADGLEATWSPDLPENSPAFTGKISLHGSERPAAAGRTHEVTNGTTRIHNSRGQARRRRHKPNDALRGNQSRTLTRGEARAPHADPR